MNMRLIAQYAVWGFAAGSIATVFAVALFPHFYSHVYELYVIPFAECVIGALAGALVVLALAVSGRSRRSEKRVSGRRLIVLLAVFVLLPVVVYVPRSANRSWKVSPELLALCIDGGTWKIMDPLIEAGKLPNIAKLKREGTSAVLVAAEPMYSMIAWTTIGAGVEPSKHGITTFYDTQNHLQSKRIWEIYEDAGHTVGLFRWWITWPPRVTNGFVIPDILARDAESFPPKYNFINQFRLDMKSGQSASVFQRAAIFWRYLRSGLRFETCVDIAADLVWARRAGRYAEYHIASRRAEIRLNADVYCHMLREIQPEYTCFYDNGVDQMCHFYWQFFEPQLVTDVDAADVARYGDVVPDFYALHDEIIGRILEHVDPTSNVVVLSDHGFTGDKKGARKLYFARGVPILSDMGMKDDFFSIALGSRTFIESVRRDPIENRAELDRVVAALNSLTVRESGVTLFNAWIEEEGRIQLDITDDLLTLDGHVETPTGTVQLESWFNTRALTGTHHPDGIFVARGPAFKRDHAGERARQIDVAPTILYATGYPLSQEFDGAVAWDWIEETFRRGHDVVWVDSYGRFEPVEGDVELDEETLKKLRALGYVQ